MVTVGELNTHLCLYLQPTSQFKHISHYFGWNLLKAKLLLTLRLPSNISLPNYPLKHI